MLRALFIVCGFVFFSSMVSAMMTSPQSSYASDVLTAKKEKCWNAIKASVTNPSTLKIHIITGYASRETASGLEMLQTFSAKNAFGMEGKYNAYCVVSPQGELKEFQIANY